MSGSYPAKLSGLPTSIVNAALTIAVRLAVGCGMNARTTQAGGCFLTFCILAGFAGGIALGNPMKGGLIGTAAGALVAVLLWLVDRRRR